MKFVAGYWLLVAGCWLLLIINSPKVAILGVSKGKALGNPMRLIIND